MWLAKSVSFLWGLLFAVYNGTLASGIPYINRPRLFSEDGNLYITCAMDRNITLRTSGQGYININNNNLGEIVEKARQVSNSIERFQNNEMRQFQQRLNSLSSSVLGSRGFKERLERLEGYQQNASTLSPAGRQNAQISRLNRTVVNLAKDILNLRIMIRIDDCVSNPCQNGGKCYDLINGFHCICPDSWEGKLCNIDVNECANFAGTDLGCQNNAQCINKRGNYECQCAEGWYGIHCSRRTLDCTKSSSEEMCGHGFCINSGGNGQGFTCICKQGWTTDTHGKCTKDVNECELSKHVCSSDPFVECINIPGSFLCGRCPQGYSGNGHYCSDINECEENNGGCSLVPKVKCINTQGSRDCFPCPAGYYGDGITCTAALGGRCSANNGGCHYLATCVEAGEVVSCHCPVGYVGTGYGTNGCQSTGVTTNACQYNYCRNGGTCIMTGAQTHVCNCLPGFSGSDCSLRLENPCLNNPCLNNGLCTVTSSLSVHGFRCSCPIGYSGDRCQNEDSDCTSVITLENGVLSYPRSFVSALHETSQFCHWIITVSGDKVVQLKFKALNTESSALCSSEYVEILDGQNPSSSNLGRFCGTVIPDKNITSTSHTVSVIFKSQRPRSQSVKFSLDFHAVEAACSVFLHTSQPGLIESPGYPSKYPPNKDCWWSITAPFGKQIKLNFYTLNLKEGSYPCDILQVLDGHGSTEKVIGSYCNETSSVPLVSNTRDIRIHFKSDEAHQGAGFRIGYELISGCGDILTGASGDITPPRDTAVIDKVTYRDDDICEWQIQLPVNEKVILNFIELQLEDCERCNCDYVAIFDGPSTESPKIGQWCGNVKPPKIITNSNIVTILFKADYFINEGTFHLHYDIHCGGVFTKSSDELMSSMFPHTRPMTLPCVFKIEQPVGKAILLTISNIYLVSPPSCFSDYLEVRDGDSKNSTLIGKYCEKDKVPDLILSSYNYLYLEFLSTTPSIEKGFRANYTVLDVECGGIIKDTIGTIASPVNVDSIYSNSVHCSWVIVAPVGHFIQLSWAVFNLEPHRECRYDFVEIFDNSTSTGKHPSLGKFCGSTIPSPRTSSGNIMTIVFESDHSVGREGFLAHYIILDGSKFCGGTFSSVVGEIKSPNFPEHYPYNKICVYKIQVPTGQQIELTVNKFELEKYYSCDYDYLEIRDGSLENSPLLGRFCGTEIPSTFVSMSNTLYIKFESDSSNSFSGFHILWDGTSTGCGGSLTGSTGSIYSPNYPQPYGNFGSCFWKISVSKGSKIQMTIVDIELEDNFECNLDYIKVFDGPSVKSKVVGQYCNNNHPSHILSTGNQLYIEFVSDVSLQGRGFHLIYTTVCNTTIRGQRGMIESLNFPDPYPLNRACVWVIIAPKGNNISYSFSHFGVEDPSDFYNEKSCIYDYVEITEGDGEGPPSRSLGRFCGQELPPSNISTMDHVYVTFKSDHFSARNPGFHLEWAVSGCGGELRHPFGTFQSPNYPGAYPHSVICEWYITLDWEHSVEITVNNIELEETAGCGLDYLQIFGGPDSESPLLTKLCYSKNPVTVTTSGNHAFVRFNADFSYTGRGFTADYRPQNSKCGGMFISPIGEISTKNYPNNYGDNEECEWLITVPENHLINFTFIDFDIEEQTSHNITDVVYVYDGPDTYSTILFNNSGKLQDLNVTYVISTSSTILVQFKSDPSITAKGFKAKYRTGCGARIVTSDSGFISTADAFHTEEEWSSVNSKCTWYIIAENLESRVTLAFNHLDSDSEPMERNGKCIYKNITVYDGEIEGGPVLLNFCGDKIPTPVRSSGHALTLTISKAPYMSFGIIEASYSVLPTACGGVLTAAQGFFASPNYPEGYPNNAECIWEIRTSPGNRAMISFIDFHLESSEHCNLDYVEVRLGSASDTLHETYCGNEKPVNINASSSFWVKFSSSELTTAKGFLATYSLSHGNYIEGIEGDIGSPFYPKYSTLAGVFKWVVTVDMGSVVRLTFKEFFIEKFSSGSQCSDNSLKIYDGRDETSPLIGQFCGPQLPDPVLSHGISVTIVLNLVHALHRGSVFLLHWEETLQSVIKKEVTQIGNCSEMIELGFDHGWNSSYTFTSPGYPNQYNNSMHCEWVIQTTPYNHIELKFTGIDFEVMRDECIDYVQVFKEVEQGSGWEQLHRDICRSNETKLDFMGSRKMKIVMETDDTIKKGGFSATAAAVCGGTVRDFAGVIDMTRLKPRPDTDFIRCTWTIIVKSGRTIEISYDKFDLPKETSCTYNYLVLRNGGHADSPFLGLGKYCGSVILPNIETSSNRLYIEYSARSNVPGVILKFKEVTLNCGGDIQLTPIINSVNFTSPNYPNVPPPHTECIWKIYAPAGENIQLDFIGRFDLQRTYTCVKEYIEVRDGGTEMSPMIGDRICIKPSTITTTDNMMYMKYFTDVQNPNNGFFARAHIGSCGGTSYLHSWSSTKDKTITSPNYPETYPVNTNCTWHVVVPDGRYFNFFFKEYQLGGTSQCTKDSDSLTVAETDPMDPSTEINNKTVCGTLLPSMDVVNFTTDTNTAVVHFTSKANRPPLSSRLFNLELTIKIHSCGGNLETSYGTIESPGYSSTDRFSKFTSYCKWEITVPEGRRITLQFIDFDLDPAVNRISYFIPKVQVYNGVYLAFIKSFRGYEPSGTTVKSSSNKMIVLYLNHLRSNHRGFKAEYSSDEPNVCGGKLEESGIIHFHTEPNQTSEYCQWIRDSEKELNQTFVVQVNGTLGNSGKHYCRFRFRQTTMMWLSSTSNVYARDLGLFCSLSSPQIFTNTLGLTSLSFAYSANNSSSANFTIKYKTNPCGGVIYGEDTVVIKSPGYPEHYPPNMDCAWSLVFPEGQINITFEDLHLEEPFSVLEDKRCTDYVVIYNGASRIGPKFDPYCGSPSTPFSIISQSNYLWIEFHSNEDEQKSGFQIRMTSVSKACGGTFHANEGILQSPNYPQKYPNNIECEWEIVSEPGYHIGLVFVDRFHIEKSQKCVNDYIQVFDYVNGNWIPFEKICDREEHPIYNATSSRMKIIFHSNDAIAADGFKALWNVNCGGEYRVRASGFITSPNYPHEYPDLINCTYTLVASSGTLNGHFEQPFGLENSPGCKYDNLSITTYRRMSRYGQIIGPYCGNQVPPPLVKKTKIVLSFITDYYASDFGFFFNYSLNSCGNENMTKPGIIRLPSFRENNDCIWFINAPKGKIVVFEIIFFYDFSFTCQSYLEIWDGPIGSKLIRKVCSDDRENEFRSTNNTMTVKFISSFRWIRSGLHSFVSFSYSCGGVVNVTKETPYTIKSLDVDNNGKYEEDLKCDWHIISSPDYLLYLTFVSMDIKNCGLESDISKNASCECDYVVIYDGSYDNAERIGKFCGNTLFPPITSSTNHLFVRFVTDSIINNSTGFQLKIEAIESPCGEQVRWVDPFNPQVLTSPGFPSTFPHKIICSWHLKSNQSNSQINIYFNSLNVVKSPSCSRDRLEIRDVQENSIAEGSRYVELQNIRYCGKMTRDFVSNSKVVKITYIIESYDRDQGFSLQYSLHKCNKSYTEKYGHINNYFKSSTCEMYINAPGVNDKIALYFNSFNSSVPCEKSKIIVRDGQRRNSPILLTSCGPSKPNPVFSSGNSLYIYVKFDEQGGNYDLTYTTTSNGQGCGGPLGGDKGSFSSPLYPLMNHKATDCRWDVTVLPGHYIEFTFSEFSIGGQNCSTDFIEFYNTNAETNESWFVTRLCAEDNPANIPLTSNTGYVHYVTSVNNNGTGWVLQFESKH